MDTRIHKAATAPHAARTRQNKAERGMESIGSPAGNVLSSTFDSQLLNLVFRAVDRSYCRGVGFMQIHYDGMDPHVCDTTIPCGIADIA